MECESITLLRFGIDLLTIAERYNFNSLYVVYQPPAAQYWLLEPKKGDNEQIWILTRSRRRGIEII